MKRPKPACYTITTQQEFPNQAIAHLQTKDFVTVEHRCFVHPKNAYANAVAWAQRKIKKATGKPIA